MINKLYSKIKKFIKENIVYIIIFVIFTVILNMPIPYYINSPGGLINVSDKVIVNAKDESSGSFNLTYVSEVKGNVFTFLLSKVIHDWDLVSIKAETTTTDNLETKKVRNKILLNNSLNNAYYVANNELGNKVEILNTNFYVLYIDENANTNLEVGDVIKEVNGIKIKTLDEYSKIINNSKIGDTIELKVVKDEKEKNKYVEVNSIDGKKNTLIYIICDYDMKMNNVSFNFSKGESGPSGGFMIALSIYDKLNNVDLTKGKKIAGTGTIDLDGRIGEISGVRYKIIGASENDADIFLCPKENYKEAKEVVQEYNLDIKLVKIEKFSDAIKYLSEI